MAHTGDSTCATVRQCTDAKFGCKMITSLKSTNTPVYLKQSTTRRRMRVRMRNNNNIQYRALTNINMV